MAPKIKFVIMSAIYLLCIHINEIDAICHLDHMKRYALNSCEMLIDALNDNYPSANPHNDRLKREILGTHNSTANYYDESRHVRPIHLRMKNDGSFPAGGYIVIDHLYAKILRQSYPSTFHVIPKTLYLRPDDSANRRHHHSLPDGNEMSNDVPYRRRKRNHDDKNVSMPNVSAISKAPKSSAQFTNSFQTLAELLFGGFD